MSNTRQKSPPSNVLSSDWHGLNEYLIARIFEVDNKGFRTTGDSIEVHAPFTECNIEATLNWQSPFENSSADQKAPALVAILQSGGIKENIEALPFFGKLLIGNQVTAASSIEAGINRFEGRTGITKLNSTQIFTGMPPLKISAVLLFRAYKNSFSEVERPLRQLWQFALPKQISSDSLVARLKKVGSDTTSALLPSKAPTLLGLEYKRRYYAPLVIESIGEPLSSPIDAEGFYTEVLVPITFGTLTALDREDMRKSMSHSFDA